MHEARHLLTRRQVAGEVGAGTERLLARAGDGDGADGVVRRQLIPNAAEVGEILAGRGVALRLVVQGDQGDVLALAIQVNGHLS